MGLPVERWRDVVQAEPARGESNGAWGGFVGFRAGNPANVVPSLPPRAERGCATGTPIGWSTEFGVACAASTASAQWCVLHRPTPADLRRERVLGDSAARDSPHRASWTSDTIARSAYTERDVMTQGSRRTFWGSRATLTVKGRAAFRIRARTTRVAPRLVPIRPGGSGTVDRARTRRVECCRSMPDGAAGDAPSPTQGASPTACDQAARTGTHGRRSPHRRPSRSGTDPRLCPSTRSRERRIRSTQVAALGRRDLGAEIGVESARFRPGERPRLQAKKPCQKTCPETPSKCWFEWTRSRLGPIL